MGSTAWAGVAIGIGVLAGVAFADEGILRVGRSEDDPPFTAGEEGFEVEAASELAADAFEARIHAPPGTPLWWEPPRGREVDRVGPRDARSVGPRIGEWLAADGDWIARSRRERLALEERCDAADRAIDLLARRLETMPLFAAAERRRGLSVAGAPPESAILDAVAEEGRGVGLEPESARWSWRSLIALRRRVQERTSVAEADFDLEGEPRPALPAREARGAPPLSRFEALRATLERAEVEELAAALGGIRELAPRGLSGLPRRPGADLPLGGSGLRLLGAQPTRIAAGVGVFDPSRTGSSEGDRAGSAAAFQLELRSGPRIFWVAPLFGVLANSKGGVMGCAGAALELALGRWIASPVFAVGAYEEGSGKRLGGVFEFQVGGSLAYELAGGTRLTASFLHLSNANIHRENPGTEFVLVGAAIPLR